MTKSNVAILKPLFMINWTIALNIRLVICPRFDILCADLKFEMFWIFHVDLNLNLINDSDWFLIFYVCICVRVWWCEWFQQDVFLSSWLLIQIVAKEIPEWCVFLFWFFKIKSDRAVWIAWMIFDCRIFLILSFIWCKQFSTKQFFY